MEPDLVDIALIKDWLTIASILLGAVVSIIYGVNWINNKLANGVKEHKTYFKDLFERTDKNKEDISLLKQTADLHGKEITTIKESLEKMGDDITSVKETVSESAHKSKEDTLTLISELKSMEGRTQLSLMEFKESLIFTMQKMINERDRSNERRSSHNDSS